MGEGKRTRGRGNWNYLWLCWHILYQYTACDCYCIKRLKCSHPLPLLICLYFNVGAFLNDRPRPFSGGVDSKIVNICAQLLDILFSRTTGPVVLENKISKSHAHIFTILLGPILIRFAQSHWVNFNQSCNKASWRTEFKLIFAQNKGPCPISKIIFVLNLLLLDPVFSKVF